MRDALVGPLLDAALPSSSSRSCSPCCCIADRRHCATRSGPVWTQGRDQSDRDVGNFDASRDYRNLFAPRPDNVLLIKAAYWIGR